MPARRILLLPMPGATQAMGRYGGSFRLNGKDRESNRPLQGLRNRDAQNDSQDRRTEDRQADQPSGAGTGTIK
jgi:hypothetical protein